jgi:predicted Ser/Thr protein kinase
MALPDEIEGRWKAGVVLKRDVLSTVERGRFVAATGEVEAVLRRIDEVPWWSFALAQHLFARERDALAAAAKLGVAPPLCFAGKRVLVRGWIDGVALHLAKPHDDHAYFRSAKAALRALHRAGICHNDLAKEQNWLRGGDGRAYLTDFQLAIRFKRRGRMFRMAAYEDLRHLLKHKRRYAPRTITAAERRVLARKSLFTRMWMATGKRVYYWVTRDMLRFTDREGAGPRLVYDAPRIAALLRAHPQVREVAIVAYPDRRAGTGLYAFVEARAALSERDLRDLIARGGGPKPPEHLQVTDELPRRPSGEIREEILQLVAMNQLDLIETLIADERERALIGRILADRRNLLDRFAF